MAKRLEREFGRYDVDALDSDEYLGMPAAVRTDAYFYLLMLSGRSRKRRTDGVLTRQVADDIAHRMKCSAGKLLGALAAVAMVTFDETQVVVLKYAKWQETKEEIETRQQQNRDRQAKHRHVDVTDASQPGHAAVTPESRVSHANVTRDKHSGHVTEKEKEKEKEIVSNETIVSLVTFDPQAERLMQLLSGILEERGVKFKAGKDWMIEADRLIRLDKRDAAEASELLIWATSHHFWASNILSMSKFREKYDQLRLQRERELTQPSRPNAVEQSINQLRALVAHD